tara:strand:+ start:750 stop:1079 length:330 start_codon:yes stop_codon:yes gene_type:complete
MYKKDLKKLSEKQLKMLVGALKRSRDASQNIYDRTDGVITHGGGRKELKQHLRWYETQLSKVLLVLYEKHGGALSSKAHAEYGRLSATLSPNLQKKLRTVRWDQPRGKK